MKKLVIALMVVIGPYLLINGQDPNGNYNPFVNSGTISPSPLLPLEANGTGVISFNIGNTGSDPLEVFSDQHIILTITLSYGEPNHTDPLAAIGGASSDIFLWDYNSGTYTGTQITTIPSNSSGTITIDYKVTQNSASPGYNGFNLNITPAPYQTTSNTQNDDAVSSYTYTEVRDFGDAPLRRYGSAEHILDFENYLGSIWDGEESYLASIGADGDDTDGQDDEDGVAFPAEIHRGDNMTLPVSVTGLGRINAWIDWNGDGDFADGGERIAENIIGSDGTVNLVVTVPADATITDPIYARFRFTPGTLSSSSGSADGGEVEDYRFSVLCAPPDADMSSSDADNTFCDGTPVTFTAGGGTNYNFRIDGTSVQNGSLSTFSTATLANNAIVDVIVTDDFGCSATSDAIVNIVNPLPAATLTSSDADNTICDGSSVTFTAGGGSSYNFRLEGTSEQNGSQDSYTTASLTNGQVIDVIVTDGNGCSATSAEISITVNPIPSVPVVDVVDNCDGSSILSTGAVGALLWSTGASTPSITVNTAGTYTVTTTLFGCASETGSGIAAPRTAPSPPVLSNTTPVNLCPEVTIDLTDLVTSNTPVGGSIFFKLSDNTQGADVPDPTSVGTGTYYVFYQNLESCYSTGTGVLATINDCPPDITPTLIVNPNIMHGITSFDLTVRITELTLVNTSGTIVVNIPKDSRWILADGYIPSLTLIGSTTLNNNEWAYTSDAINHIFTSTSTILAGESSTFGFRVTFDPGSTRGVYTITSQVVSGGGGEVHVSNNADSEKIDYFQE